jgi:RimJ/RimL family protein N-acetyltransferase
VIRGEKVGLRARQESDVAVLHTQLYDDVELRARTDNQPWLPIAPGSPRSPFAIGEPVDRTVPFSVQELATGELAGVAALWGIDTHNRSAHLGISLLPACRGRGLGTDAVRALCTYGFAVRDLRRLQLETMADNAGMIAAAGTAGFSREGTLRRAAWAYGQELDVALFGLLREEWAAAR